jgi:hypothetical protein
MPPVYYLGAGEPLDPVQPALPARLTAAVYNVHNLSAANLPGDQARFERIAEQIVEDLAFPDLLVLLEIQDDYGAGSATLSAVQTLTALTAAIQSAGGPVYAWLQIDPLANQDGGAQDANIRPVILYNPARLTPTAAPPGDALTPVALTAPDLHLSLNPGRIAPDDPAFSDSRKPLVAEFTFQGHTLFVVACHLNSKIGDQPLFGPFQPPAQPTAEQREAQTAVINAFARQILARDPWAYILVLGDLNDNAWSVPLLTLENGGDGEAELFNLKAALPYGEPHYSYIYQGNAQAMDHIYASPIFDPLHATQDDVHINIERWETDPLRASDHDPVWASLEFPDPPPPEPEPEFSLFLPLIRK